MPIAHCYYEPKSRTIYRIGLPAPKEALPLIDLQDQPGATKADVLAYRDKRAGFGYFYLPEDAPPNSVPLVVYEEALDGYKPKESPKREWPFGKSPTLKKETA